MIHYIELIPRWLISCSLLLVPFAQAADDDINIPYTDTYGYVYDPATGSFVKNDAPAAATDTSSPASAQIQQHQTPPALTDNTQSAVMSEPVAAANTDTATDPNPSRAPWIILAVVAAGIAVWRLLARKVTAVQHTE